jgi:uncharacterized membrane protein
MKRIAFSLALMLLGSAALSGTASAGFRVANGTPNTIFVGHAYSSVSGIGCGYDDGCAGTNGEWRIRGWFQIAPGAIKTVHSQGYGNAMRDIFADDAFGNVWDGNTGTPGGTLCAPFAAHNHCSNACPQGAPTWKYRRIRNTRCCGGTCPGDFLLVLRLGA